MEKVKAFLDKYSLLVILVLSIPAMASLLVPGFYGASDDLHIGWLHQMDTALKMGQIPPRFVPDLSFGFGYPLFNFVFPLPFYLAEIFHLIGLSLVGSIKAVFLLTLPLSGYFMYKLSREYTNQGLSLASALVYIFTPYRSTDIFVRGAIGESVAFIFLPLIIWSIIKVGEVGSGRKFQGVLALSTAALITSHNIMAYMFLPFALLFLVTRLILIKTPRLPVLAKSLFGIFLGLAVSSFFWVPAIVESPLMKYDTVFNFVDHFPTVRQLLTPFFGYGASVPGPGDGMSFYLGTPNLFLLVSGVIAFTLLFKKLKHEDRALFVWLVVVILTSFFMMNHRSALIWDRLPLLAYFQFPWRFLTLTTLGSALFAVFLDRVKYSFQIGLAIAFLAIVFNFSYFAPNDFLGRQDAYYLDRYIPFPEASSEYKKTAEEYLRLPQTTKMRPDRNYPRIAVSDGQISNEIYRNHLEAQFEIESSNNVEVNYYKYFFPGWVVKIDGRVASANAGQPFGQMVFQVPNGKHLVEVSFKETPFRALFDILSLLALAFAFKISLLPKKK